MTDNPIRQCIEEHLGGLTVSPRRHDQMRRAIVSGRLVPLRRKIGVAVLVLVLLLTASALAATGLELLKPRMDALSVPLLHQDWDLDTKMQCIGLLQAFDFAVDPALLSTAQDEHADPADRENAADRLLDQVWGALLDEQRTPGILQQEEYPSPDLETVFTLLYRQADPDATESEIARAYAEWEQAAPYSPAAPTRSPDSPWTEAELRQEAESYLREVVSLSRDERAACQITLTYHAEHDLWLVDMTIPAASLREAWKQENGLHAYRADTDSYAWQLHYGPEGSYAAYALAAGDALPPDERTVAEVMAALIPDEAWRCLDEENSRYRCFLRFTAEERAAFSAQWKPVVDDFLRDHPAYDAYFRSHAHCEDAYITTRHAYGIPAENALPEAEARALAREAYLAAGIPGVSAEMIDQRCRIVALYDVTEKPVWKVSITYDAYASGRFVEADHKGGFAVLIDPFTHAVTRRDQTPDPEDGSAYAFAEMYL